MLNSPDFSLSPILAHQYHQIINSSINSSTHQFINSSIHQLINIINLSISSTHQYHQLINANANTKMRPNWRGVKSAFWPSQSIIPPPPYSSSFTNHPIQLTELSTYELTPYEGRFIHIHSIRFHLHLVRQHVQKKWWSSHTNRISVLPPRDLFQYNLLCWLWLSLNPVEHASNLQGLIFLHVLYANVRSMCL